MKWHNRLLWLSMLFLAWQPAKMFAQDAAKQTSKASGATSSAKRKAVVTALAPQTIAILEPKLRVWLDSLEERARKVVGQQRCIEGFAGLESFTAEQVENEIKTLRSELAPRLAKDAVPRIRAADEVAMLIADTSPKTRAAVQESLGQYENLRVQVTSKMVTFNDVLSIDDYTLAEMLDEIEPEQIAAIVTGLSLPDQQRLARVLSRKVIIAVQTEIQRLSSRPSNLRRAQAQSITLQAELVEKLKALIDEGVVEPPKRKGVA